MLKLYLQVYLKHKNIILSDMLVQVVLRSGPDRPVVFSLNRAASLTFPSEISRNLSR